MSQTLDLGTVVAALQLRDELTPALKQAASTASSGAGAISGSFQPIIDKLDEVVKAVGETEGHFSIFQKSITAMVGAKVGEALWNSLKLDDILGGLLSATGGAEKMKAGFEGLKGTISSAGSAVKASAQSVASLAGSAAAAAAPVLAVGAALAAVSVAAIAVVGVGAGLLAVFGGLAAFTVSAVKGLVDTGSRLTDLSAQTGIAVESLQTLGFAGELVGVSMDEISSAAGRMAKAITAGDDVFARLGLQLKDLRALNPEQQFVAVASAIADIRDPTQQAAATMEIFRTASLLPLIKSDIPKAAEEFRKMGAVMSTETASAADELGDEVTKLGAAWDGLKNNVASALVESGALQTVLGTVKDVIGSMSSAIQGNQDVLLGMAVMLRMAADAVADFVGEARMIPIVAGFFEDFRKVGESVRLEMAKLTAQAALGGAFKPAGDKPGGRTFIGAQETDAAKKAAEKMAKDLVDAANWAREKNEEAALKSARAWLEFAHATDMVAKEQREAWQKTIDEIGSQLTDKFGEKVKRALDLGETFGTAQGEAQKLADTFRLLVQSFGGLDAQTDTGLQKMGEQLAQLAHLSPEVAEALALVNGELEERGEKPIVSAKELQDAEELINKLGEIAGIVGQLPALVEAFGVSADSALGKAVGAFAEIGQSALGFAATLADPKASVFTKISAGISAAMSVGKAIIGAFTKSDAEKAAEIAGRVLGTAISKGLADAISKTSKELGISKEAASMLHLGEAMDESGQSAASFAGEMSDLLEGIELGAIPAQAGIEAMGEAFGKLADEASAGSVAAMASMGALATQAKQFGIEVPEITAAIKQAVGERVESLSGLGGIQIVSESDAKAQAQIFLNTFNDVLASEGVVAAAKAIGPSLKTFQEQLAKAGIDKGAISTILGPINSAMSLMKNEMTKGAAEGVQALKANLEGGLKTGALDIETFRAIEQQSKTAFDQMIAGGADTKAAFMAIGPLLAQIQQAAAATGQQVDPVTQGLIEQAKAAGVAFPVGPMEQMVELMKVMVTGMGFELPAALQQTTSAIGTIPASTAAAAAAATGSLDAISNAAVSTSTSMVAAFGGVGDQITTAILPAADAVQQGFMGAWDAASAGASLFVSQLSAIAGKEIGLNFKFGGGGAEIPVFQHGGWLKANPPHGTIFRAGEKEDEAILTKSGLAKLMAGSQRGSRGQFVSNLTINASNWGPRRLADEMNRVKRRNMRSWTSTGG